MKKETLTTLARGCGKSRLVLKEYLKRALGLTDEETEDLLSELYDKTNEDESTL